MVEGIAVRLASGKLLHNTRLTSWGWSGTTHPFVNSPRNVFDVADVISFG